MRCSGVGKIRDCPMTTLQRARHRVSARVPDDQGKLRLALEASVVLLKKKMRWKNLGADTWQYSWHWQHTAQRTVGDMSCVVCDQCESASDGETTCSPSG